MEDFEYLRWKKNRIEYDNGTKTKWFCILYKQRTYFYFHQLVHVALTNTKKKCLLKFINEKLKEGKKNKMQWIEKGPKRALIMNDLSLDMMKIADKTSLFYRHENRKNHCNQHFIYFKQCVFVYVSMNHNTSSALQYVSKMKFFG